METYDLDPPRQGPHDKNCPFFGRTARGPGPMLPGPRPRGGLIVIDERVPLQ